ncbi:MAG: hypothetical protein QE263_07750 [Vampirovibrionales bacterium]|nr:hypothetical protein [Vampirovibrionales bacterium]
MSIRPVNFGYSGYFLTKEEAAADAIKHNSVPVGVEYLPQSGKGSEFKGKPIYSVLTDEKPNSSKLGDLSAASSYPGNIYHTRLKTLEPKFDYQEAMA